MNRRIRAPDILPGEAPHVAEAREGGAQFIIAGSDLGLMRTAATGQHRGGLSFFR